MVGSVSIQGSVQHLLLCIIWRAGDSWWQLQRSEAWPKKVLGPLSKSHHLCTKKLTLIKLFASRLVLGFSQPLDLHVGACGGLCPQHYPACAPATPLLPSPPSPGPCGPHSSPAQATSDHYARLLWALQAGLNLESTR